MNLIVVRSRRRKKSLATVSRFHPRTMKFSAGRAKLIDELFGLRFLIKEHFFISLFENGGRFGTSSEGRERR